MKKLYILALLLTFLGIDASGQIQMPLPVHNSVYSGIYTRGYWFVAPTSFTITGLMVAPEAGTGLQYIHVMKCHDPFPIATSGSANFTTLAYISGAANNTIQSVSIPVTAGDTIGVLGTVTGISNSYTASGTFTSTIGAFTVNINRMGYQGSIEGGPAPTYWGVGDGLAGELGRVFIYYSVGPCTDPPTAGAATASSSVTCIGSNVTLSLNGNTFGSGQTYTWESAASAAGPYTPIGGTTPSQTQVIAPTSTAWYRAVVACGFGTDTSAPVQVSVVGGISGTFTIDQTQPAGNGNFTSFATALASLNCTLNGPVTFNVVPNTGPYNEQITITPIAGASASNPVVINGNGNTVQFTPVSSARHLIKLDGADHITINNLNLTGLSATYGWGVHLINGADSNTISNCSINLMAVTSTSTANSAGIVGSNSSTSGVSNGNNGNYNTFSGNTISGGYRSVSFLGNVGGLNAVGNSYVNNTIQDFYADGFYVEENDGTIISGNHIQRPIRTNATTGAGIECNAGNRNMVINGNYIHDTHTSAGTSTFYGIYFTGCDAPLGMENKVTNNLLYKFNASTGTIYALYNSGSDGVWYYHNTIVLDNTASTSGVTRGFYQTTTASNIQLKNNNFYITRAGSGTKYVLYFNAAASAIQSDNNNLYINAPAGSNYIGYFGGNQASLANWKAVNGSTFDQQSVSLNPNFQSPATNDYTPTNVSLDDLGTPVGVLTDINNVFRSTTTPDLGAIEFLNPLSVTLLHFSAGKDRRDVLLSWTVAAEKNLDRYVVERSVDGIDFGQAGTVPAAGSSHYMLRDKNAQDLVTGEKLYYRLKSVEAGGSFGYSDLVTVRITKTGSLLTVTPVPFTSLLRVEADALQAGTARVILLDAAGKVIVERRLSVVRGHNILEIPDLGWLSPGVYQLLMEIDGERAAMKLVK